MRRRNPLTVFGFAVYLFLPVGPSERMLLLLLLFSLVTIVPAQHGCLGNLTRTLDVENKHNVKDSIKEYITSIMGRVGHHNSRIIISVPNIILQGDVKAVGFEELGDVKAVGFEELK